MGDKEVFTEGVVEGLTMAARTVKRTPATNRLSLDMAYDAILQDIDKIHAVLEEGKGKK
jgi:hypothetical protein